MLIAVREGPDLDREGLILRLEGEASGARYARHQVWRTEVRTTAARLRLLAALVTFLAFAVMGVVITLAVRAALAVNAGVIGTLRMLGARDSYITRAFVRRFTLRGAGGAATGTFAGLVLLLLLPAGEAAALGGLRPQGAGWLALPAIPVVAGIMAFVATGRAARAALGQLR